MERNLHTMPKDLAKKLEMFVEEEQAEQRATSTAAAVNYMGETDLKEKYKNEPDQLANIFANAASRLCPVRGVHLWEGRGSRRRSRAARVTARPAVGPPSKSKEGS